MGRSKVSIFRRTVAYKQDSKLGQMRIFYVRDDWGLYLMAPKRLSLVYAYTRQGKLSEVMIIPPAP